MPPDCVVVEVAVLDLPENELAEGVELWEEADEQQLPIELRRKLASNGLRCGVIGGQLPNWIRRGLDAPNRAVELDPDGGTARICDTHIQRRVQCRPGKRSPIQIGPRRESLNVGDEVQEEEETTPAYEDAQCQFTLSTTPEGDGTVAIQLTPEIHHGRSHQCWVAQDGVFRVDSTRDCESFDDLRIETTLSSGQTLLLTASQEPMGLGKAFFAADAEPKHSQTVLLIRLAQTQLDDLFAPDRSLTPIATANE